MSSSEYILKGLFISVGRIELTYVLLKKAFKADNAFSSKSILPEKSE